MIVLLIIISLCIVNHLSAIPKRFRSFLLIVKYPVSVEDDREIASSAEQDFPIQWERLVTYQLNVSISFNSL